MPPRAKAVTATTAEPASDSAAATSAAATPDPFEPGKLAWPLAGQIHDHAPEHVSYSPQDLARTAHRDRAQAATFAGDIGCGGAATAIRLAAAGPPALRPIIERMCPATPAGQCQQFFRQLEPEPEMGELTGGGRRAWLCAFICYLEAQHRAYTDKQQLAVPPPPDLAGNRKAALETLDVLRGTDV